MSVTAVFNCIILSDGREQPGKAVLIAKELILDIIPEKDIPSNAAKIDLKGSYVAPGLIDLQIYGSGGKLFGGNPSVEALEQMEKDLFKQGTTGFLATVATNTSQIIDQAIRSARAFRSRSKGNFMGLHLEGPYLNAKRKGAHPEALIKKASLTELKEWIESAEGEIKMITLAPELQDDEVIAYLNRNKIIISCGHSNASYDEAIQFLTNTIPATTHLYNAMPPAHHRNPGLVPAIFKQKPYTSIVADGIHVSYPMIELAKRELGDKLFLITDSVTGTDQGIYPHILMNDHYVMPDGTLSGSSLTMLKAVSNCVKYAGISLPEAINMASKYPADLINADNYGLIKKGYPANMVVFDPNFTIEYVLFNGERR